MLSDDAIGCLADLNRGDYVEFARSIESAARSEALEDAAKVCDERQLSQLHDDHDLGYDRGAIDCAKDIRALKEQTK